MTDEQGIEIGFVVGLQDIEIGRCDKGRAEPAGRHQQEAVAADLVFRQRLAVHPRDAKPYPVGDFAALVRAFQRTGDIGRHMRLKSPALAALPAILFEVIGNRRQRIGHRIPNIAPAVAIEIDGKSQKAARQELRMPQRAGP